MFISTVQAAEASGAAEQGSLLGTFLPIILIGVFFYFVIIRPQSKRTKEHKNMLEAIQKGDEVVTNGGILGKVTKITDGFMILNVAQGVEMKFQKHAITASLPKGTIKDING